MKFKILKSTRQFLNLFYLFQVEYCGLRRIIKIVILHRRAML